VKGLLTVADGFLEYSLSTEKNSEKRVTKAIDQAFNFADETNLWEDLGYCLTANKSSKNCDCI